MLLLGHAGEALILLLQNFLFLIISSFDLQLFIQIVFNVHKENNYTMKGNLSIFIYLTYDRRQTFNIFWHFNAQLATKLCVTVSCFSDLTICNYYSVQKFGIRFKQSSSQPRLHKFGGWVEKFMKLKMIQGWFLMFILYH